MGAVEHLDSLRPAALLAWAGADDPDLCALAALAPRLTVLFRLEAPCAPGAVVIGALLVQPPGAPLSVTGVGFSRRAALAACLGEAAEVLAQAPHQSDIVARGALMAPPPGHGLSGGELRAAARRGLDPNASLAWARATRLPDGAPCLAPAGLVLRHPDGAAGPPSSLGCAAGPSVAAARRAAVLEVIERDAAARWRRDGRAARLGPHASRAVAEALRRTGGDAERAWLARIDRGGGPPVVAARSAWGEGVAAGLTETQAATAALREMIGAETGAAIAAARGRGGGVLAPLPPPCGRAPAIAALGVTLARLAAEGYPVRVATLDRPDMRVPVVKAVCFGLAAL